MMGRSYLQGIYKPQRQKKIRPVQVHPKPFPVMKSMENKNIHTQKAEAPLEFHCFTKQRFPVVEHERRNVRKNLFDVPCCGNEEKEDMSSSRRSEEVHQGDLMKNKYSIDNTALKKRFPVFQKKFKRILDCQNPRKNVPGVKVKPKLIMKHSLNVNESLTCQPPRRAQENSSHQLHLPRQKNSPRATMNDLSLQVPSKCFMNMAVKTDHFSKEDFEFDGHFGDEYDGVFDLSS